VTYLNVSQFPRPLVLLLFSVKDDRTNGVSIYFFFLTNLDVSLKKQFITHDIKYLTGTICRSLFKNTALCEVLALKRKKKKKKTFNRD